MGLGLGLGLGLGMGMGLRDGGRMGLRGLRGNSSQVTHCPFHGTRTGWDWILECNHTHWVHRLC